LKCTGYVAGSNHLQAIGPTTYSATSIFWVLYLEEAFSRSPLPIISMMQIPEALMFVLSRSRINLMQKKSERGSWDYMSCDKFKGLILYRILEESDTISIKPQSVYPEKKKN
jgi:hypothetical protein